MRGWGEKLSELSLGGTERVLVQVERGIGDALRTTRFLRGWSTFRSRSSDVYVVTYPRSGTTWVQFILYLLKSRDLAFDHISQVSPWWERSLALGYCESQDFEAFTSPRVFKSHLPRRWLPEKGRFIYIVRDGLDVAVSYHSLYRSHLGFKGDFGDFFELFLRGELQYGSWFKHVEGWRKFSDRENVLLVGYEHLLSDLRGTVSSIVQFLGWSVDHSILDDVVQKASFNFMKAHEERFDPITETLLAQGLHRGKFIREGKRGRGEKLVTPSMRAQFNIFRDRQRRYPDLEAALPDFLH